MFHKASRVRAGATIVTAGVLLVLTFAVPMLDRGSANGAVVIVSDDASVGLLDHDHRICLQYAAAWLLRSGPDAPAPNQQADEPAPRIVSRHPVSSPGSLHRPRAPPVA